MLSYRVSYDGTTVKKTENKRKGNPMQRWLLIGILLLTGAAVLRYTGAARQIWLWLLPGDGETTADAFQLLTQMLTQGESLKAAVTAFCRRILEGAQLV